MNIEELQKHLENLLISGTNKKTDGVLFRPSINVTLEKVDYLLTSVIPNTLVLCHDDGNY